MTHLDSLTRMNVELEGLLHLLKQRDSLEARAALTKKFEDYSALMKEYLASGATPAPEVETELQETVAEAQYVEVKNQEAQETEDVPEEEMAEQAIEHSEKSEHLRALETSETSEASEGYLPPETFSTLHPSLQQAFTLNDRFRFTRMLFNGDAADFSETINLLSQLPTREDVHDYLINDLMLNPDDEVVKEFLSIIDAHIS